MPKHLVIVESPTKARTLRRFLGREYLVDSSLGHIRDLPASAKEIPPALKQLPWARLGVNVEEDFNPIYVIHSEKRKKLAELKEHLKDADSLFLATDEDREGEAISWHLVQVLRPKKIPVRRMVFHEITREAILESLDETREIDRHLVDAQEARRIVDRLYGYEVSPILWRKIAPRLSAGRVQSVAIRMLVEREQARMRFHQASYWDLTAELVAGEGRAFAARLVTLDGARLAGGKDFDPDTGLLARANAVLLDEATARRLAEELRDSAFTVLSTEEKPFTQSPPPPFTTSTLQQEANRKLRFDARRTMRAAQRLYENGRITYMRTDSVVLSEEGLRGARRGIVDFFGEAFLPASPRLYSGRVKNAQEAHEAIRPAGDSWAHPEDLGADLGPDERKIYDLVFKRTLASQMPDARGRRMSARIGASAAGRAAVFQAGGSVIDAPGFLRAYHEDTDEEANGDGAANGESVLPPLAEGDAVAVRRIVPEGHLTQPPPRLTEAALIKSLEESGIGRPSTYASIIDTILRREYTFKKGTALVPTFTAFAVVNLMKEHLTDLIDYEFTARMEDRLDAIARGEEERLPYLTEFYRGNGSPGLKPILERKAESIDPRAACTIPIPRRRHDEGPEVVVRVGRYGPYLQRADGEGATAPVPEGICPDELTHTRALELLAQAEQGPQSLGTHPESGLPVYVKSGRYGPYVQLGDPEPGSKTKPKMVSLLPGMSPETISLAEALQLLSLPRSLGTDDAGVEIVAHYGRYGAYVKRGTDTRSLEPEDNVLTVTRERALELLAREKRGRGFRAAPQPLKSFGAVEALAGREVRILSGRYGPYVTDGETNASLPRELANPAGLSLEEAIRLLEERKAAGPRRRGPRRGGRAQAGAKKTGAKRIRAKEPSGSARVKAARTARGVESAAAKTAKSTRTARTIRAAKVIRATRPAGAKTAGSPTTRRDLRLSSGAAGPRKPGPE